MHNHGGRHDEPREQGSTHSSRPQPPDHHDHVDVHRVDYGLASGIHARSVALIAFAGDSAVELLSATVVLMRFRLGMGTEGKAARINAVLLYVLAAYIVLDSVLSLSLERLKPRPSLIGIGLLIAAGLIMPILGTAKTPLEDDR